MLVCLLPLGVLQPVADSRLVDIGDVRTKDLVLTAQLVHLMFEFAVAFLHAIEQSVRDAALHTVELVLVRGVGQIHVAVRLPQQLFLVKFLYVRPFLFHLFHFLALGLFRGHTYRHDALYTGLRFFETYPEARLETGPLPVHFRTGIFIMEEVIVPVRCKVPRAVLH